MNLGVAVSAVFLLTSVIPGISTISVFALVTGPSIGSVSPTEINQQTASGPISKIQTDIDQENECKNDTDCDNKTGTESNVQVTPVELSVANKIYTVENTSTETMNAMDSDYEFTATAECNEGDTVVGGGEKIILNYGILEELNSSPFPAPPSTNPTSWVVTASIQAPDASGIIVSAYALCFDNP